MSTWIYRVSLNTILTKIRKNKNSIQVLEIESVDDPSLSAHGDDDVEFLKLIMTSLNDLDKGILILHLEGYCNREIAEILKISPSNVSTRFNRVKAHLKKKYNREYAL